MYVSKYPRTRFIVFCEDTQVLKLLNHTSARLSKLSIWIVSLIVEPAFSNSILASTIFLSKDFNVLAVIVFVIRLPVFMSVPI